jgi:hypothetical protein
MGVRNLIRILIRNPDYNDLSLKEIKEMAEKRIKPENAVPKAEGERIKKDMIRRMEESKVDPKVMIDVMGGPDNPKNILEIVNSVDEIIVSENVRRKTINVIVSIIRDRGFFVENKNIRLLKETNTVTITAVRPGGQKAEFNVNLNGGFISKFDEYEGQACQKDIKGFIEDLDLHGMKIYNIREDWSNPDKTMKMNYQKMDVKKGG